MSSESNKVQTNLIYIIQEREFVNSGENVFKYGRTDQLMSHRIKGYSKGTEIILTHKCANNNKFDESALGTLLKSTFKSREDIGKEYIEGSREEISRVFMEFCLENMEQKPNSDVIQCWKTIHEDIKKQLTNGQKEDYEKYLKFIERYNNSDISDVTYEEYKEHLAGFSFTKRVNLREFTNGLIEEKRNYWPF